MARRGNFYPRSPCGERRTSSPPAPRRTAFLSTLSLRRATFALHICVAFTQFLSTLSLRRATIDGTVWRRWKHISIHALLAESDLSSG